MRVKISIKTPIGNRLEALVKAHTRPEVLRSDGAFVRDRIIKRTTKESKDVDGQTFEAYSTERIYMSKLHRPAPSRGGRKKALRGGGRSLKTVAYDGGYAAFKSAVLGHSKPTLYGTSLMFASLMIRVEGNKAVLYFGPTRENAKAWAHDQGDGVPRREFMGFGKVPGEMDALRAHHAAEVKKVRT